MLCVYVRMLESATQSLLVSKPVNCSSNLRFRDGRNAKCVYLLRLRLLTVAYSAREKGQQGGLYATGLRISSEDADTMGFSKGSLTKG